MSLAARLPYLKTKLSAPKLGRAIVKRPRLLEKMAAALDLKVTVVVADAGYGKTTLVSDFITESGFPAIWYQLDSGDNDLLVFLRYLVYGLRQHYQDFGEITLELLQAAASRSVKTDQLADTFLNEVSEQVENKTVVVLDDFHMLDANDAIGALVSRLLAYLPDTLHIVITTRTQPELNLARLRSKQSLCWIDRDDLAFSESETLMLFNDIYQRKLPPERVREYWSVADGWVTALQLICQSGAQGGRTAEMPINRESLFDVFEYFAEDVFGMESEETRERLVELSLLDSIEPGVCSSVLGVALPLEWLDDLVRRNVFISRRGEPGNESYIFHPLFRTFLQRRLATTRPAAAIAGLHRSYATYAAEHSRYERALYHAREGADKAMVVSLLATHGATLIGQGAFETFKQAFDNLTTEAIDSRPMLLNMRAEICLLEGDYTRARMLYEQAINLAERANAPIARADALRGLAMLSYRQWEISQAQELASASLACAPPDERLLRAKSHNILGLCFLAQGALDAAIEEWRQARANAIDTDDSRFAAIIAHNLGLPYLLMGLWEQAIECFNALFTDASLSPHQAVAYLNIARLRLLRGEFAAAGEKLEHALESCRIFNLRALRGEVLETLGNLHRDQGDYARARANYASAEQIYEEVGLKVEDKELLDERAVLHLLTDQLDLALETINRLYSARAEGSALELAGVQLTRARVYLARGEVDAALADSEACLEVFRQRQMYYHQACASAVLAEGYLAKNNKPAAKDTLQQTIKLVEDYGYQYWLQHQARLSPTLLALLDSEAAITMAAPAPEPVLKHEADEFDLTVRLFGPVQIYARDQQSAGKYTWSLKQALSIFCFIAANRNHRASKETIIDTFWRDASQKVIAKNFHPTISYIRKALNTGLIHKRNFLLFTNDAYQLNSEYRYYIDTDEFNEALALAARAKAEGDLEAQINHLRAAVELYRGDFLAELFDDWIDAERASYLNQYLTVLSQLAVCESERGQLDEAIGLYQKILARDSFREEIHCRIMELYKKLGNQAAIKEQYDSLRRLLKKELKVEPLAETEKLYRTLTGK